MGGMTPDIAHDQRLDPRLRRLLELVPSDRARRRRRPRGAAGGGEHARGGSGAGGLPVHSRTCATPRRPRPRPGSSVTHGAVTSRSPTATPSICRSSGPTPTIPLPCVYYIHGGGMATMSCFDGMYRGWGKHIAANGVAVVMVDFRNCVVGLVGARGGAVPRRAQRLRVGAALGGRPRRRPRHRPGADRRRRRERRRQPHPGHRASSSSATATSGLVKGLYALCPYIAGQWPAPDCPSSVENEGILLHLHNNRGAMGYGIEAFNERNPLAWPSFAERRRRHRLPADGDQRQRVRPAARRGDQLLPPAARGRGAGPLPPDDGDHARDGDLHHRLPRHQPRHRPGHRRLRPRAERPDPAAPWRVCPGRYAPPP